MQTPDFTTGLIATAIKIVLALGFILTAVPMLVWLERKLIADFQARVGPQRVGPFGLLQSFADGIKLVAKESLIPTDVDRLLYLAAPVVVMIPALAVAAVVPFGAPLKIGHYTHKLAISDLPVGFLFVLALTSLSVYGIVLSGWASNNKYSLLGGLRSSAQMVSYELPMGFCIITGLMIASQRDPGALFGLNLSQVVDAQAGGIWNWSAFNWKFGFIGFIAMVLFYVCGLAETNRAPFDLPEAETELIGGYHTEYGGLRWAMFFLGEYAAMLNVAAVTSTLFLGGWRAPYPDTLFLAENSIPYALQGVAWFGIKVFAIITVYIWIRATLPRLRYDRLMDFGWKFLIPVTLGMVLAVASILTFAFPKKAPAVLANLPEASAAPETPPTPGGEQFPAGALPGMPGMRPGRPGAGRSNLPRPKPGSAAPATGTNSGLKPGAPGRGPGLTETRATL